LASYQRCERNTRRVTTGEPNRSERRGEQSDLPPDEEHQGDLKEQGRGFEEVVGTHVHGEPNGHAGLNEARRVVDGLGGEGRLGNFQINREQ